MVHPSRIAVDASAARMSGGLSRTRELAMSMAELAPQHEYVFALGPGMTELLERLPPKHRVLEVPRRLRSVAGRMLWEHTNLPRAFTQAGAEWVISPFNVLPLGPGFGEKTHLAVIVSNIGPFAPEVVATMRGYQAVRNRILRALTQRSLRIADHVFLLSNYAEGLVGSSLRGKSVTLLPMAPPAPELLAKARSSPLPPSVPDGPFFVTVGDFFPYKGIEDAVRAVGELRRTGTEVRLVVVGHPNDRTYSRLLEDLAQREAPGGILFLGGLSHVQTLALIGASAATIVCSRAENPSRVPLEAMAMGSALIASDIPAAVESSGDAALYYPVGDWRRLGEVLLRVLRDPGTAGDMLLRSKQRFAGRDWKSASRSILETLDLL
jgi:glycosyltransferase involved in cell wall biosynthesis